MVSFSPMAPNEVIVYVSFEFSGQHINPYYLSIEMYKSGSANNVMLVNSLGADNAGGPITIGVYQNGY